VNTGRAVLVKTASDVATRASGLITFPIVAAYIGAEGYGAFSQVSTVVGVVIPLASIGIGSGMVRFFATQTWSRGLARQVLHVGGTVALLSLVATALIFVLAPLLNDAFLGYKYGDALFRWGALLVLTGALEYWLLDLLRARDWLMLYAGVQFSQTIALVAATAFLLIHGQGVVELMIATVIIKAAVIGAAILLTALRGRRAAADTELAPPPEYRRMVQFGLPLTIAGLGLWMVNLSDRLVVGGKLGAAEVGRYGIVYNLATLLVMGASGLFLPAYARLMRGTAAGDRAAVEADITLFHRYIVLVIVPLAVWLAVIIKPAVRFLGGEEFSVGLLVVLPIVAAMFLNQWNGLAHYVLIVNDRTPLTQNLWLGVGLGNIGLCLVLVPLWGLEGAAVATLAAFVVIEWVQLRASARYVDIVRTYQLAATARVAAAAAAAAVAAIAVLELLPSGGVALVAATLAFFPVYVAAAWLLREVHRGDLDQFMRAVRPKATAA
jgi:O-antigen/teichoic acid export membrane protein